TSYGPDWNVPELESGFMYVGPLRNESNICLCSSVVYNAVSSCAACQGKPWVSFVSPITWLYWIKECVNTHITVANYKVDIPLRTAIPRWMYQDPTQQPHGSFNPDPAFLIASQQQPDITSDNQAGYSPPTPTASPGSGNSAKIGAIVGGVVGGIGILTAGVILGRWFLRRRYIARSSLAPSKRYITEWSKEVPYRQVLSRWAGTSYGSDSVVGEPAKGRDMMTPTSTLPASYPNTPDGQKSSPYDGQQQSTTQPLVRDLAAS
ncbi:hypothetical protein FRC00_005213, partial [Tulasnella sp. 408]